MEPAAGINATHVGLSVVDRQSHDAARRDVFSDVRSYKNAEIRAARLQNMAQPMLASVKAFLHGTAPAGKKWVKYSDGVLQDHIALEQAHGPTCQPAEEEARPATAAELVSSRPPLYTLNHSIPLHAPARVELVSSSG
jgi:hypothetical protein